jgi:hypothetical protein
MCVIADSGATRYTAIYLIWARIASSIRREYQRFSPRKTLWKPSSCAGITIVSMSDLRRYRDSTRLGKRCCLRNIWDVCKVRMRSGSLTHSGWELRFILKKKGFRGHGYEVRWLVVSGWWRVGRKEEARRERGGEKREAGTQRCREAGSRAAAGQKDGATSKEKAGPSELGMTTNIKSKFKSRVKSEFKDRVKGSDEGAASSART